MESLDYWRLCEQLTVVQAALLIIGIDPSEDGIGSYIENWEPHKYPPGYQAAKAAVSGSLMQSDIDGKWVPLYEYDVNGTVIGDIQGSIDIQKSVVFVGSLRRWLAGRGFNSGFFFPGGGNTPEYLDIRSPRYAPKLAAAIRAWEAVCDPVHLNRKSPKQALTKWLREHASEFGLSDEEGKPNETGIEEVAKVANWRPTGGAPKTPEG